MSPRRRLPTLGYSAVVEIDGRPYGVTDDVAPISPRQLQRLTRKPEPTTWLGGLIEALNG